MGGLLPPPPGRDVMSGAEATRPLEAMPRVVASARAGGGAMRAASGSADAEEDAVKGFRPGGAIRAARASLAPPPGPSPPPPPPPGPLPGPRRLGLDAPLGMAGGGGGGGAVAAAIAAGSSSGKTQRPSFSSKWALWGDVQVCPRKRARKPRSIMGDE